MRIGAFELHEPLPQLKEPHAFAMLRPWVDVGSVGTIALASLERHFHALELGKLARPGSFFDFTRYRPMLSHREGKRIITVPNTHLYYAIRETAPDFIFLHMLEPHALGEDYAESVVQLLQALRVRRYALIGAMYDAVPHTRPLLVTGSVTVKGVATDLGTPQVERSTYEGPTTITYTVGQQAAELGMDTASLIVHLPQYAELDEDFSGAARALEVLSDMYGLPPALIDAKRGEAQYQEISQAVARNPRLKPVVEQLEARYDARASPQPKAEGPRLSPGLEEFLREMDERFDAN